MKPYDLQGIIVILMFLHRTKLWYYNSVANADNQVLSVMRYTRYTIYE